MTTNSHVTIRHSALRELVCGILHSAGVAAEKAELMADSLVAANLRGVDSHGVHLLPHYLTQLKSGNIDPSRDGRIISESGACLLYDGEHGLGHFVSAVCCGHAVRIAREHGIGMVVARNSNHFGAAAFWAQRISAESMIGVVMCNASPAVPPWQGREGRLGTNPICVSVPSSGAGAWLLDMATTTVAKNKIVKAASNHESTIPAGWAMDSEGIATTDTQRALRGLLMPLGGYKGSGLGMMVEVLCAVLSGGSMSTEVGGLHLTERKMNTSQTFLAIDISRFLTPEEFQSRMEYLVRAMKSARTAPGYDEILVAGDPEWRIEERRLRDGVPIEWSLWNILTTLAVDSGIPVPEP
ncbi:MAG TPA: Ldh family oxidoreductase [Acidobacteriota bacterium]|nr:Ldh family oxidoreductase [Acidobacteriota bacterium]